MTRLRALVADDDTELLAVVVTALEDLGAQVVAVSSGGALLEKIANAGAFDVIITDISMPWMSGMHVMHSARTAGLPVPVVVMTGLRDPGLREQVSSLGAHAVLLYKPFSVDQLRDAVRASLAPPAGDPVATTAG